MSHARPYATHDEAAASLSILRHDDDKAARNLAAGMPAGIAGEIVEEGAASATPWAAAIVAAILRRVHRGEDGRLSLRFFSRRIDVAARIAPYLPRTDTHDTPGCPRCHPVRQTALSLRLVELALWAGVAAGIVSWMFHYAS